MRKGILSFFGAATNLLGEAPAALAAPGAASPPSDASSPSSWAYSSVSTFGVRYSPPLPDLTTFERVEALVEGSPMSKLVPPTTPGSGTGADSDDSETRRLAAGAWRVREGRRARYEGRRVGGTVAVHFIKKSPWYLETALALLDGDERTALEIGADAEHRLRGGKGIAWGGSVSPGRWVNISHSETVEIVVDGKNGPR